MYDNVLNKIHVNTDYIPIILLQSGKKIVLISLSELLIVLDIEFNISENKKVVSLKDGYEITVWNHFSHTLDNLIQDVRDVNLGISYISRSPDKSEVLLIYEIDK
jgi:accessory gene regulator protein AgrB